jgi:signal transduction histidine kinase
MSDLERLSLVVLLVTLLLLLLFGFMAALLILNANRRHRHRAELAELHVQRMAELAQATREATEVTLAEVGRELHDSVGQLLCVAQLGLRDRLRDLANDAGVTTALGALDEGITEVRRLGRTMNNDLWQQRGLIEAITTEAERLERLGRAKVNVVMEGRPGDPPPDARTILFRTFQEVVQNALRHSGARTMEIGISDRGGFTLTIADDGRGFDADASATGSGLLNIRKRCALIGYRSELHTAPGAGTRWTFSPEGA